MSGEFDSRKDSHSTKLERRPPIFIKNYNEESDEGYFFEVDIQYLEKLHELHNDSPFLPERMKIES